MTNVPQLNLPFRAKILNLRFAVVNRRRLSSARADTRKEGCSRYRRSLPRTHKGTYLPPPPSLIFSRSLTRSLLLLLLSVSLHLFSVSFSPQLSPLCIPSASNSHFQLGAVYFVKVAGRRIEGIFWFCDAHKSQAVDSGDYIGTGV